MYCFIKTSVSKYNICVLILLHAVIKGALNLPGPIRSLQAADKDLAPKSLFKRDDITSYWSY